MILWHEENVNLLLPRSLARFGIFAGNINSGIMKQFHTPFILLLFCSLISQQAQTQDNYVQGYVVTNAGERLSGWINYRNWRVNPDKIAFKEKAEAAPVFFTPTDILELGVSEDVYISAVAPTEISPVVNGLLDDHPRIQTQPDTAFFRVVFQGDKNLYHRKHPSGKDNFYIRTAEGFQLLEYKRYFKMVEGQEIIAENKNYLRQLAAYLADCPDINAKLNFAQYNLHSLSKIFTQYHECIPGGSVVANRYERTTVHWGAVAGASLTDIQFTSPNPLWFHEYTQAEYTASIRFAGGIYVNIDMPRKFKRWSLYNELSFTSFQTTGTNDRFIMIDTVGSSMSAPFSSRSELGMLHIKLMNSVRYAHQMGKMSGFAYAGISNGLGAVTKNHKSLKNINFPNRDPLNAPFLTEHFLRRYEQALVGGIGAGYNKTTLEFRFELGNGMSEVPALQGVTRRYYLLAGYRLN